MPATHPLLKKTAAFPASAGVYFMKDAKGRTLYIGKAKSLRARASSYFQAAADLSPKIAAMVEQAADVEFIATDSEVDALLLEARLVRDTQPRYNTTLKDDKSALLIGITRGEDFGRVYLARESDRNERPDDLYYGPFQSAADVRGALKVLQRVFKYRTCTLDIRAGDPKNRYFRPCILHAISQCTAPCADRIGKEDYAEDVRAFTDFLAGKKDSLVAGLEARMQAASKALQFERAAAYRDQAKALRGLSKMGTLDDLFLGEILNIDPLASTQELQRFLNLPERPRVIEGIDLSHTGGTEAVGSLVSFVDGVPFKSGYRRFRIKTVKGIDDYAMMAEVVRRRFKRLKDEEQVFPDVLLLDGGLGHVRAIAAEFERLKAAPPVVLGLAKHGTDHLFRAGQAAPLDVPRDSAGFHLLQFVRDESHRFAQQYHKLLRRKRHLES